jgi:N-acetylglucosaminyldiphosphoundecaprenol N-acetyl-beta-D-mannosaminyltransferase
MSEKIKLMGFCVYDGLLDEIIENERLIVINTISPNSYGISTKDYVFKKALKHSDYLLLDGVYFALPSLIIYKKKIKKNQGPEIFKFYMKKYNNKNKKIFFLGSTSETLNKIKNRAEVDYPNIEYKILSPPFKDELNNDDDEKIIKSINEFKPDILFVGMTCPKQEKWVYKNKKKINAKFAISIGGVFDWYAGNEKEIAPIWWKLNLAWLIRTINRPEILKRYPNIGIFFWHLILAVIGIKKYKYGNE